NGAIWVLSRLGTRQKSTNATFSSSSGAAVKSQLADVGGRSPASAPHESVSQNPHCRIYSLERVMRKQLDSPMSSKGPHSQRTSDANPLDSREIAKLAHHYWEMRGRAPGHYREDRLKAEEEVRRQSAGK